MATCAACGAVSVERYCVDCVASGQAAYDAADRRGDRAGMAAAVRDFETLGTYNRTHAGKAWSIVGMTTDNGGVYCAPCWGADTLLDDGGTPVFQSDEHCLACDHCGELLPYADPTLYGE